MNVPFIAIQVAGFCVQVACIYVNVRLFHKNSTNYLRWHDRIFLRLRWLNIGIIIWATFWMAWAIYWIANYMGVIA